jgi:HD-GYP domain-containing protein (c-di-GMP phosphodiesterase class II)
MDVNVSTWDQKVITKRGDRFSGRLLTEVADMGKKFPFNLAPLGGSFIMDDLQILLKNEQGKYGFIMDNPDVYKSLIKYIEEIKIPPQFILELTWLKQRYNYNYQHILGVTAIVTRMAMDYFWNEEEIRLAAEAAILFDIGLGKVDPLIFTKEKSINKKERTIIDCHPIFTALLIAYYYQSEDHPLIEPVLNHHENRDKSGYPRGVENLHILSNQLRAADLFHALISERPFRKSYSMKEAMKICAQEIDSGKIIHEAFPLIFFYNYQNAKVSNSI